VCSEQTTTRLPGAAAARGRERGDEPGRRRVLDVAVQARGQAEQVGEPGERHLLELLERRRGAPEDPDLVQRRDEELGEDPGSDAVVAKYAK
jgi:hypothetical protein